MAAPFDPAKHHRRSIRLKGYDYSQPGAYFITVCTHGRENLFGEVQAGTMQANRLGRMVERAWLDLPAHYPHVRLDAFCLMPNHVHGIIVLAGDESPGGEGGFGVGRGGSGFGGGGEDFGAGRGGSGFRGGGDDFGIQTRPYGSDGEDFGIQTHADGSGGEDFVVQNGADGGTVRHGLPEIVRAFKSFSARRINDVRGGQGSPVWQRNYYEHIIRNQDEFESIRAYMRANPARWETDNDFQPAHRSR